MNQTERLIQQSLSEDPRVVFAYFHGSALSGDETARDIDIAVYALERLNPYELSADLKIALHRKTGLAPDVFDVQVINNILEEGDLFGLLFLKNMFARNALLVDKAPEIRTDFIERYGMKYRECEGLIGEVLS